MFQVVHRLPRKRCARQGSSLRRYQRPAAEITGRKRRLAEAAMRERDLRGPAHRNVRGAASHIRRPGPDLSAIDDARGPYNAADGCINLASCSIDGSVGGRTRSASRECRPSL